MGADRTVAALLALGAGVAVTPAVRGAAPSVALLAHVSGMVAGFAAAVLIVLMSRAPWLERTLGTATLVRWHAAGGRAAIVLLLTHAVAATAVWRHGFGSLLGVPGLATATAGTALLLVVGVTSARAARRRLPYEAWHLLHLLTYVAVGLCFLHQLAGPDLAGRRGWQTGWALLYCYAFGLALRYRLIEPVRVALRHRMVVEQVVRESADTVTIRVRGRHLHELAARPGQFFRWRFLTAASWHSAHPFSLSAPANRDQLRLTVKAAGRGSRRLLDLRPGVRVLATGPYGRGPTASGRPALLVAGGVGITPLRAIFETLTAPSLVLLYRASTPADVLFRDELDEIAQRRSARLIYLIGPSSDPVNAVSADALERLVPDLRAHDVYVCASARLTDAVRRAALAAGVPAGRLHLDALTM